MISRFVCRYMVIYILVCLCKKINIIKWIWPIQVILIIQYFPASAAFYHSSRSPMSACHNLDGQILLSIGWQCSQHVLNDSVLSNIKHGAGINKIKHCLNSKDGLHKNCRSTWLWVTEQRKSGWMWYKDRCMLMDDLLAAVRLLVSRGSSNDTEMCVCEPCYPTQQLLGTLNRDVVATL